MNISPLKQNVTSQKGPSILHPSFHLLEHVGKWFVQIENTWTSLYNAPGWPSDYLIDDPQSSNLCQIHGLLYIKMNRFGEVVGIWDVRNEVKDMMSVIVCGCCIDEKYFESVSSVQVIQ